MTAEIPLRQLQKSLKDVLCIQRVRGKNYEGRNVTDFKVDERVYPYRLFAKNDTSRAGTLGGFLEYILIPEAKKNHSLFDVDECIDRLAV